MSNSRAIISGVAQHDSRQSIQLIHGLTLCTSEVVAVPAVSVVISDTHQGSVVGLCPSLSEPLSTYRKTMKMRFANAPSPRHPADQHLWGDRKGRCTSICPSSHPEALADFTLISIDNYRVPLSRSNLDMGDIRSMDGRVIRLDHLHHVIID